MLTHAVQNESSGAPWYWRLVLVAPDPTSPRALQRPDGSGLAWAPGRCPFQHFTLPALIVTALTAVAAGDALAAASSCLKQRA